MADFASMLKYLREREGLTQRELAEKLGISAGAIGMYESGKRHPKFEDEEAMADFFNVDLNTLRGRRTYEGDLDLAQVAEAMRLYNIYLNASPELRHSMDVLIQSAQIVAETAKKIPTLDNPLPQKQGPKPRASVPELKKDTN